MPYLLLFTLLYRLIAADYIHEYSHYASLLYDMLSWMFLYQRHGTWKLLLPCIENTFNTIFTHKNAFCFWAPPHFTKYHFAISATRQSLNAI